MSRWHGSEDSRSEGEAMKLSGQITLGKVKRSDTIEGWTLAEREELETFFLQQGDS